MSSSSTAGPARGPARVPIRVRPGAARTAVGGSYGDALVVRVSARAVDGRATDAALRAFAQAFGLRPGVVRLAHGATSRDKLIQIDDPPADLWERFEVLRGGG